MKAIIYLFSFLPLILFSQANKCDCIVELSQGALEHKFLNPKTQKTEIPPEYISLVPPKNSDVLAAQHKIVKDSDNYWLFIPNYNKSNAPKPVLVKKLGTTFHTTINFMGKDSIPIFAEPDSSSKIITYIKRNEKHPTEIWFSGCKEAYIRVAGERRGWITRDHYPH